MAVEQERVATQIAARGRAGRAQRRWTLDELAARSGVSRRLIVQIERAESKPSIGTLLKLAAALGLPLSDLLSEPGEPAPLAAVPGADALTLWSTPAGSAARLLVSHGPLELWSWTLEPGDRRTSDAHRPGSLELLSVHAGTVALDVGDHHVEIPAGDGAWFEATHPHAYGNPGAIPASFTLVVLEPA